ncbi:hypothetical protein M0R45_037733 [Rubus argutus]|uniref:Uncharacterized protein n=1 Tax=Rubus argutus TaxID=59490 RepID=A0AAW1W2S7_RUBAR
MASIAISASFQIVCGSGSLHVTKKQQPQPRPARALETKEASRVVALYVEAQNGFKTAEQDKSASHVNRPEAEDGFDYKSKHGSDTEASTNDDPVLFRSSIIPWWAWLMRSYLPEAELLNGRAAMVGFFMAYVVDSLTGVGVVGQTGNFICKAGLLVTVIGIILFRRTEDIDNLKKLADEATFYDKQWQAF